jgi:hypothetical protein
MRSLFYCNGRRFWIRCAHCWDIGLRAILFQLSEVGHWDRYILSAVLDVRRLHREMRVHFDRNADPGELPY